MKDNEPQWRLERHSWIVVVVATFVVVAFRKCKFVRIKMKNQISFEFLPLLLYR